MEEDQAWKGSTNKDIDCLRTRQTLIHEELRDLQALVLRQSGPHQLAAYMLSKIEELDIACLHGVSCDGPQADLVGIISSMDYESSLVRFFKDSLDRLERNPTLQLFIWVQARPLSNPDFHFNFIEKFDAASLPFIMAVESKVQPTNYIRITKNKEIEATQSFSFDIQKFVSFESAGLNWTKRGGINFLIHDGDTDISVDTTLAITKPSAIANLKPNPPGLVAVTFKEVVIAANSSTSDGKWDDDIRTDVLLAIEDHEVLDEGDFDAILALLEREKERLSKLNQVAFDEETSFFSTLVETSAECIDASEDAVNESLQALAMYKVYPAYSEDIFPAPKTRTNWAGVSGVMGNKKVTNFDSYYGDVDEIY